MASLMQKFAETRQQRLQARAGFVATCELARQSRAEDLKAQSQATAKYLAHAEQTRFASEQGRQAIAEIALESRQQQMQNRSLQVSDYLQDLNSNRNKQSVEDVAERAQEVRTRTFKMRSQLKHIHKARIRAGKADLAQRQQLAQDRAALIQMQLEEIAEVRLAKATVAAQQRMQEFSDRAASVKVSLAEIADDRSAETQAQALKLATFCSNLSAAVWSGDRAIAPTQTKVVIKTAPLASTPPKFEEKKSKIESVAVVVKVAEPAIVRPIQVKEAPKETTKTSSKIEQFVVDYVAQLSTNSSLLEVVNDRDTVRDLLAQGANTLKVDPSDILNTLLQMAEGS